MAPFYLVWRLAICALSVGCGRIAFDVTAGDAGLDGTPIDLVGELDPDFGNGGIVRPNVGAENIAWDVAAPPDRVLAVGVDLFQPVGSGAQMFMVGLTDTGALDATWNGSGILYARPVPATFGYGMQALPDGGALWVGDGAVVGEADNVFAGRVTASGVSDTAFGTAGSADFDMPPGMDNDSSRRVAIADGIAYICSTANYVGPDIRGAFVAMDIATGALVTSFASPFGIVSFNTTNADDHCGDISVVGAELIAGVTINNRVAYLRMMRATGSPYPTVFLGGSGSVIAQAITAEGAVLMVAYENGMGVLARFVSDALDASFGGTPTLGRAALVTGTDYEDIILDNAGRIILTGANPSGQAFVARYTATGTLDTSFGANGSVVLPFTGKLNGVALDPSGRIVAAGTDLTGGVDHAVVVRIR